MDDLLKFNFPIYMQIVPYLGEGGEIAFDVYADPSKDLRRVKQNTKNEKLFENLDKPWFTTKEAANYLGRSVGAIRNMVYRGQLNPKKSHGRLYFRKVELDLAIENERSSL